MTLPQLISVHPDPLVSGQQGEVCFDFSNPNTTSPVDLQITWTPSGSLSIQVSREQPCHDVWVYAGSSAVLIEDDSGQSMDYAGAIIAGGT